MTAYEKPSFTVPLGRRDPTDCEHGFIDRRGYCCFCGADPATVKATHDTPKRVGDWVILPPRTEPSNITKP